MNLKSLHLKLILGITYLVLISVGLFFLFSVVDIKDLTNYEFIRSNKDIILKYKNENFLFLTVAFFVFSIVWILLLGFVMPLLLFAGFVFGKWWGVLTVVTATTIGATLLYMLAGFFFHSRHLTCPGWLVCMAHRRPFSPPPWVVNRKRRCQIPPGAHNQHLSWTLPGWSWCIPPLLNHR